MRALCGGASGDAAVGCVARFFSSASNWLGSYFFCSAFGSFLAICWGGSGFSFGRGASAFSVGFGGSGLGSGGFSNGGGAGLGSGSFGGSGDGASAEGGGTGVGTGGSGSGFATGASATGTSGFALGRGGFGLGSVTPAPGENVTTTPVAAASGWSKVVLNRAVSLGLNRALGGSMILNWTSFSAESRSATRKGGTSLATLPELVTSPSITKLPAVRVGTILPSWSRGSAVSHGLSPGGKTIRTTRQVIPSLRRIALIPGRIGPEAPNRSVYSSKSVRPSRARLNSGRCEEGFSSSSLTRDCGVTKPSTIRSIIDGATAPT